MLSLSPHERGRQSLSLSRVRGSAGYAGQAHQTSAFYGYPLHSATMSQLFIVAILMQSPKDYRSERLSGNSVFRWMHHEPALPQTAQPPIKRPFGNAKQIEKGWSPGGQSQAEPLSSLYGHTTAIERSITSQSISSSSNEMAKGGKITTTSPRGRRSTPSVRACRHTRQPRRSDRG